MVAFLDGFAQALFRVVVSLASGGQGGVHVLRLYQQRAARTGAVAR